MNQEESIMSLFYQVRMVGGKNKQRHDGLSPAALYVHTALF